MTFQRFSLMLLFLAGTLSVCAQPKVSAALNAGDYSTDLAPGPWFRFSGRGFQIAGLWGLRGCRCQRRWEAHRYR